MQHPFKQVAKTFAEAAIKEEASPLVSLAAALVEAGLKQTPDPAPTLALADLPERTKALARWATRFKVI